MSNRQSAAVACALIAALAWAGVVAYRQQRDTDATMRRIQAELDAIGQVVGVPDAPFIAAFSVTNDGE